MKNNGELPRDVVEAALKGHPNAAAIREALAETLEEGSLGLIRARRKRQDQLRFDPIGSHDPTDLEETLLLAGQDVDESDVEVERYGTTVAPDEPTEDFRVALRELLEVSPVRSDEDRGIDCLSLEDVDPDYAGAKPEEEPEEVVASANLQPDTMPAKPSTAKRIVVKVNGVKPANGVMGKPSIAVPLRAPRAIDVADAFFGQSASRLERLGTPRHGRHAERARYFQSM